MTPERFRQIEELFQSAADRHPSQRAAYLTQACGADLELHHEVVQLLDQNATGLIDHPAVELAGSLLDNKEWATGTLVGHYEIVSRLGAGGMGAVYKARDKRLKRFVAIKTLHAGQDRLRFLQEAQAASALNHPNIVQIYELCSHASSDFIVMEYSPGRTLAQILGDGCLAIAKALDYATQIATGLAAAHTAGIVHRDIKPANVIITDAATVKILDFGLAKLQPAQPWGDSTVTAGPVTQANTIMGTAAYMSPEQAESKPVDARSDIFSTGATLYEMFTGRRAFPGDSMLNVLSKVLRQAPEPLRSLRPEVPRPVERIIGKCLEKSADARYATGEELLRDLLILQQPGRAARFSRQTVLLAALGLLIVSTLAGWMYWKNSRMRWARNEALPKIRQMVGSAGYLGAYDLTVKALEASPDDPDIKQLWTQVHTSISAGSSPSGARISYRAYGNAKAAWRLVGITPFQIPSAPIEYLHWRVEKDGYETMELAGAAFILNGFQFQLIPLGKVPEGMVAILENAPQNGFPPNPPLPDFFLDKYEVTNRQFKTFMDSGGYSNRKFWLNKFLREGRELPFEKGMELLRDATGKAGPAGWVLGAFPKDQDDFPVAGVSWYEAAAYCESVGKSLPTVRHWRRAASFSMFANILEPSNFSGRGPAAVGANQGLSPFGVYDMAGNVKEWTWNAAGDRRGILGGGWNETSYMFSDPDAQDPFTRGVSYGFRCAKYPAPIASELLEPFQLHRKDYWKPPPVDDQTFATLSRLYAYDKTPLEPQSEYRDDSAEHWIKEKVSFRAVYGSERLAGYLYLPKSGKPPFQVVIHGPGGYAHGLPSSETGIRFSEFDFLMQTGRAVFVPVFKGTFERRPPPDAGPNALRDVDIQYAKDLFQSIDYLQSRPDVDRNRIGYYGISSGAYHGVFALAQEPRVKAAVLAGAGLITFPKPPELELHNFAPRVRTPVMMLNGRLDFAYPLEESQKPLFRLLGTQDANKRHVLFEGGHVPPFHGVMREVLAWFDQYLGPVEIQR